MKPGWVRLSLHPTMTNEELFFITNAIKETAEKAELWKNDYCYNNHTNEFSHCKIPERYNSDYVAWFNLP
jgi:hypothetical protein